MLKYSQVTVRPLNSHPHILPYKIISLQWLFSKVVMMFPSIDSSSKYNRFVPSEVTVKTRAFYLNPVRNPQSSVCLNLEVLHCSVESFQTKNKHRHIEREGPCVCCL